MLGEHNYCSYELGHCEVGRRIPSVDARIGMVVLPDSRCPKGSEAVPHTGFLIESAIELASIQRNCPHVWLSREIDCDLLNASASRTIPANCSDLTDVIKQELRTAEPVFSQALIEIQSIYSSLRSGMMIELDALRSLVSQLRASVRRSPNALLLLAQCKHQEDYLYEHALRVTIYSMALGYRLGMSEQELLELGFAAMLHDVGKIMIPANILDKVGELNSAEYAVVSVHPLEGRKILLKQAQVSESVIDVVMQHHERMDGDGYPMGLGGSEISPYARIVAIMDAFDAMTSDRSFCHSRPTAEALEILQRCKGVQFDARMIDVFCALIGDFPVGHLAKLSNGVQGIILGADLDNRLYHAVVSVDRTQESNTVTFYRAFAWPVATTGDIFIEHVESASDVDMNLCEYIEQFADLK